MKANMKLLAVLLTLCLIVSSVMTITTVKTGSLEPVQDGILVNLGTSQDMYDTTDVIDLTLSIANDSARTLSNVNGEIVTVSATINYEYVPVTRADIQEALAEVAWAHYIKDVWIQYDSMDLNSRIDGQNEPLSRWWGGHTRLDTYYSTVEAATSHETLYTVCSDFVWDVYYQTLAYPILGNASNASTWNLWLYGENPDDMMVLRWHSWAEGTHSSSKETGYVTHDKCVTNDELWNFIENWEENLQAGDIIVAPGHAVLYAGNGFILEGAGRKFDMSTGTDIVESDGSINAWNIEDYFLNVEAGSDEYLGGLFARVDNCQFCILRPLDLLTVDDSDGDPSNDVLDEDYVLNVGRLHAQLPFDNKVLMTSGYSIQDSAYSRLAYPAMNINRTVNITPYGTAVKSDTLTYTIEISNESNNADYVAYHSYGSDTAYAGTAYHGLHITEIIPENTVLMSAPGAVLDGNTLHWEVDVPVGQTIEVTYTVQVTGEIGEKIVCGGGMVANIPSNTITNTIGGDKLSNAVLEEMQEFFAAGKSAWNSNDGYKISAATDEGTRFAERIYNEVAGLDLQLPEVQELVDMLFTQTHITSSYGMYLQYDQSVSKYLYTLNDTTIDSENQVYRDMLVEGYYGGVWVYSNNYAYEPRLNDPRTDYLEAGDILIYMNLTDSVSGGASVEDRDVDEWQILVYLGDDRFASLTSEGRLNAIEGTRAVLPALTFDMFIALRPSQVYANVNEDVDAYVGPAADLSDADIAWKYIPVVSNILLNETLSTKLAALTAEGFTKTQSEFISEVYSELNIDIITDGTQKATYATMMKTLFSDLPTDSVAFATYDHEYTLLEEPVAGTESMYDMLLYYGGPTHVAPKPVTSLADLHPGDAILTGLRKQSCYTGMVYQGNGKFLVGTGSNSNGIFGANDTWYSISFSTDEEFLAWLSGPIDATRFPDICYEGYLVLRPSRVYENINVMAKRDVTDGPLTEDEKAVLSSLTPEDWIAANKPGNLEKSVNWFYGTINVNVAEYVNKSVYSMRGILFNTSGNMTPWTSADSSYNAHYAAMLVEGYYGGAFFAEGTSKIFTADDFEIGDIFCGADKVSVEGYDALQYRYWVALYQGDGQFLVQMVTDNAGKECVVNSTSIFSETIGTDFKYYWVLRPSQLAQAEETEDPRDITTGPLTEEENTVISGLTTNDWRTAGELDPYYPNQIAAWAYGAANVDVSAFVDLNIKNMRNALFNTSGDMYPFTQEHASYNAKYSAMLVEGYYGGTYFADGLSRTFTAADFEVGDIFCGNHKNMVVDGTKQHTYWVGIYQGNGKFLFITKTDNVGKSCVIGGEEIFAEDLDTTMLYYYVLRPNQLAQNEDTEEPRDIAAGALTDDEKVALAALTGMDWENAGKPNNLIAVADWAYKAAGVDLSAFVTDNINALRKLIFPTTQTGTSEGKKAILTPSDSNSNYITMLVNNSWGGTYFRSADQHTLTVNEYAIGDIFCAQCDGSVYLVAIYQGNSQFLVQNTDAKTCTSMTLSQLTESSSSWYYYFVLRPDQISGAI